MIRPLDDLVLLKEIDEIKGLGYDSSDLRRRYPNDIVVIKRNAYIKKEVLCEAALAHATDLSEYIQLSVLAEQISMKKEKILDRIYFMRDTGTVLFEHIKVCGMWFVKISGSFKQHLLDGHQPFLATLSDRHYIVHIELLGDLKIGFY